MKRTLFVLVACGLLGSTTLIVRRVTDEPTKQFCAGGGIISSRGVEIDGELYALGHAIHDDDLERGCSPYSSAVIQPNCLVWDDTSNDPIGKISPFYTDGTCDGSRGGTRYADAPEIIVRPNGLGP